MNRSLKVCALRSCWHSQPATSIGPAGSGGMAPSLESDICQIRDRCTPKSSNAISGGDHQFTRRAVIGLITVARRAGSGHATTATPARTRATPTEGPRFICDSLCRPRVFVLLPLFCPLELHISSQRRHCCRPAPRPPLVLLIRCRIICSRSQAPKDQAKPCLVL